MEQCKHFNNIAAIDLNFGCPSPAVIAEGAGPALLKRRKRIADIFDVLVEWKNRSKLPLLLRGATFGRALPEHAGILL